VEIQESSECYELVLPMGDVYKTFSVPYKDIIVRTIRFGASIGRSVVAGVEEEGNWQFTDSTGKKWKWIAELREQQALSLVNKIMGALTRVGLNQSEWLRLKSGK
jgi:hypothetical protein